MVSIATLFAASPSRQSADEDAFEREVTARFGLVPNFFRSAPDAPFIVRELWKFAKSAYLDTPVPTLFKERLFVYLSASAKCATAPPGTAASWSGSVAPPAIPTRRP